MSFFKDQVDADITGVFIDFETFGERHTLNDKKVLIVMDNDELQRRGDKAAIELGDFMFYVKSSTLDFVPQPNADIKYDGKHCIVSECKEDMGMYTITLRQNR